jgi:hypothetical protein
MKRPLSVIIVTKDPATLKESHFRFDVQTGFPRLRLITIFLKTIFTPQL